MNSLPLEHIKARVADGVVLFAYLGNKHRLSVLIILSEGEATVNTLAAKIGIKQTALSQHLAKLRKGKLVTTRREGQKIFYSCSSLEVLKLLEGLDDIYRIRQTSE